MTMKRGIVSLLCAAVFLWALAVPTGAMAKDDKEPLRLYVLDCGAITLKDPEGFNLKREEVKTLDLSVSCYLIKHPKGNLLFDTGLLANIYGHPREQSTVKVRLDKLLKTQLDELGLKVDYLVLSHMHFDHAGTANDYADATWLVQKTERDAMFNEEGRKSDGASGYLALENAKTEILNGDKDVFGDGAVIVKSTPGHTPGHQSLFVNLAKEGPVLLSGDLWHYPEQRTLDRVPKFNFNVEETRASRTAMEKFMAQTGAKLWIGHDSIFFATRKKAPAYYE